MEWDKDAMDATKEIPFFLRKMIRARIESAVAERGSSRVTLGDVTALRQKAQTRIGGGHGSKVPEVSGGSIATFQRLHEDTPDKKTSARTATPLDQSDRSLPKETGDISEGRFQSIEKLVSREYTFDNRFYHVKGCGGAAGCPLTLVNPTPITDLVIEEINNNGLAEFLEKEIKGPVLSHYKFKASVAGCANCCSEPQIKDVGIIAQMKPRASDERCIECMQCVDICKEEAVNIVDAGPVFQSDLCLSCGECVRVCPTGAIEVEKEGYAVIVGGKLGRHAQLATKVVDLADENEVRAVLKASITLLKQEARRGERLAVVIQRVGIERFKSLLAEQVEE